MPFNLDSLGLIALAGFLGGLIGFERELSDKPAGLRTHIFIAAGSALLVVLSNEALDYLRRHHGPDVVSADPVRIIQAIVIGISFLGAGTIVHHRGKDVEGLTTAGSIYLTAGVGIAVAVGRVALAVALSVLALGVLIGVQKLERWMRFKRPPASAQSDETGDEACK